MSASTIHRGVFFASRNTGKPELSTCKTARKAHLGAQSPKPPIPPEADAGQTRERQSPHPPTPSLVFPRCRWQLTVARAPEKRRPRRSPCAESGWSNDIQKGSSPKEHNRAPRLPKL